MKGRCPYCRSAFESGHQRYFCPRCSTVHHRECWEENLVFGKEQSLDSYAVKPERQRASGCAVWSCAGRGRAYEGQSIEPFLTSPPRS